MIRKNSRGQAVVEYLILFGFMALIAINMVKGLGSALGGSMGSLSYILTQHLTIGVCEGNCYYRSYQNSGPAEE